MGSNGTNTVFGMHISSDSNDAKISISLLDWSDGSSQSFNDQNATLFDSVELSIPIKVNAAGTVTTETRTFTVQKNKASAPTAEVVINPASVVLPADSSGAVSSHSEGNATINVFAGTDQLVSDNSAPFSNNTFRVGTPTATNITAGTPSHSGVNVTSNPSSMSTAQDTASIVFPVTVNVAGTETIINATQSFAKAQKGTNGTDGTDGTDGTPGSNGTSTMTVRFTLDYSPNTNAGATTMARTTSVTNLICNTGFGASTGLSEPFSVNGTTFTINGTGNPSVFVHDNDSSTDTSVDITTTVTVERFSHIILPIDGSAGGLHSVVGTLTNTQFSKLAGGTVGTEYKYSVGLYRSFDAFDGTTNKLEFIGFFNLNGSTTARDYRSAPETLAMSYTPGSPVAINDKVPLVIVVVMENSSSSAKGFQTAPGGGTHTFDLTFTYES